jgi:type IV secretion system protein VirB4
MLSLRNRSAIRREMTAAQHIPYAAHVAPSVVSTVFGDYVQVFRLGGASFETSDDEELNNWHERLNVLWRNIASPNICLWTNIVRRRAEAVACSAAPLAASIAPGEFADALIDKYNRRLADETLMMNEVYLAVVHRPTSGVATGLVSKVLSKSKYGKSRQGLVEALDACEKLAQTLTASMARYEPELLGVCGKADRRYSSLLEYLGLLINGEWQRMPLTPGPVNHALATSRLFFGTEVIEYRSPVATRVGAMLGIKEYQPPQPWACTTDCCPRLSHSY